MIREFFLLGQILSARARILSCAEKCHKKEAKQHVLGFFR